MFTINNAYSLILTLLISTSSFALKWDLQRKEMKRLVMNNHRALTSYSQSREFIMQILDLSQDVNGYYIKDVYCNEKVRRNIGPHKMPSHRVINVEHTWPQSRFSRKTSSRLQKADLHHLYPTNSDANSTRGNHSFGNVQGDSINKGCSSSKIGYHAQEHVLVFDPPKVHKGNVARALFYFSIRYDIDIPEFEEKTLRRWHLLDPVDNSERERNNKIAKIQGNRNPFIDFPHHVRSVSDF